MKKKTVLKMHMNCDKCRLKAMKIIASTEGVDSIAIEGNDRDQFVVIGDGVDPVKLAKDLRKNVCHTEIMSTGEVKKEEPKKKEDEKKDEKKEAKPKIECCDYMQWYPNPQLVVYDEPYASGPSCSIM